MPRTMELFDNSKKIYEGVLSVNTAIIKGNMFKNPTAVGDCTHFAIKISNGKNESTGQWYKPTFADCTAFGTIGQQILERYVDKDDIWIIAKYYNNTKNGKTYRGFNVREVINMKDAPSKTPDDHGYVGDDDIPF